MPIYDTPDETTHRLHHTYALYEGKPVWICQELWIGNSTSTRKIAVKLCYLPVNEHQDDIFVVPLDDPKFVYTEFPLGYIYHRLDGGIYLKRTALRHRQQGVNAKNVQGYNDEDCYVRSGLNWQRDVYNTTALNDLVARRYKSITEAIELSRKTIQDTDRLHSVPIHRHFSVGIDKLDCQTLWYKAEKIARRPDDFTMPFILPERKKHLRESLKETGVPTR